jgi:hypothetical protein
MEPTQCSETSAFNTQTPGKYPEDNLSLQQHGESLKTRNTSCSPFLTFFCAQLTLACWVSNDVSKNVYESALKSSRPNSEKTEFIISKLFLFFNTISLKTNAFIPAMLQRHYPVPVVVLRKICKIPLYSCNRLLNEFNLALNLLLQRIL